MRDPLCLQNMEVLEDKRHGHYLPTCMSGTVGGEGPTGEEGWVSCPLLAR